MKLVSRIEVDHFRSIQSASLDDLGDFTAFAGQNNAGKSNVLRALHVFFNGNTDSGSQVDFSRDYYCHDLRTKKKKRLAVTVTFDLPATFKFRKGLESAEKLLGRSFTIKKLWLRGISQARYYLNGSSAELDRDKRDLVEQFLSLISFRYIPNRVLPLDIIRSEHQALRDVLIRRLAKKAKEQESIFRAIGQTSASLIQPLQSSVQDACPGIGSIRLASPTSWQDLIFAFGYKISLNGSELEDTVQGSGIQSLLMFETLSLIDRDYFQKFGWKQAAIWAVEEPESSLHTSLEAKVGQYLAAIAAGSDSRLQVLCTTHSDLMIQQADKVYFAEMAEGKSLFEVCDKRTAIENAAKRGISRWTHPILRHPLKPVLLVEGKYDCAFVEQALKLLAPQRDLCVAYLELLQGGAVTGGVEELKKYIKVNTKANEARFKDAPIVVLLDWDSAQKIPEFEKLIPKGTPYSVFAWPSTSFNPKLGHAFRGVERHMSDRIIKAADSVTDVVGKTKSGTKTVSSTDYGRFKEEVFKIVQKGITRNDLRFCVAFFQELLNGLP